MSRYVDKDLLKSELMSHSESERMVYMGVFDVINCMPEADVAEVVRCKDCMWWTKGKDSLQGRCELLQNYSTGAWYCANGKTEEKSVTND